MINTKKIYTSIFLTAISFTIIVFLTGKFLGSNFFYNLTSVRIDFFELFDNFMFYLLTDLLGITIAVYLINSFVKKVKASDDGLNVLKNRIYILKKELYIVLVIVLVIFVVGLFVEKVKYFNMIFIPIVLIFILTTVIFILLMNKYALR